VTPNGQKQLLHLIGNHNDSELRKIDEKIDFNRISMENNPNKPSHFAPAHISGSASSSWKHLFSVLLAPGLLYVLLSHLDSSSECIWHSVPLPELNLTTLLTIFSHV